MGRRYQSHTIQNTPDSILGLQIAVGPRLEISLVEVMHPHEPVLPSGRETRPRRVHGDTANGGACPGNENGAGRDDSSDV